MVYLNEQPIMHVTSGIVTDVPLTLPSFLANLPSTVRSLTEGPSLEAVRSLIGELRERTLQPSPMTMLSSGKIRQQKLTV